jgi:FKBP-type peptidyl-prolyl cis-trans isomerase FkpA
LIQGLRDAQGKGQPLLSAEEIQKVMTQFQQDMMKAEQEKRMGQAEGNKTQGEAFLKENAQKPGIKTTASGLQYMVISTGAGPLPKLTDTVKVHYRGTLLDGTEFDSSYKRNQRQLGLRRTGGRTGHRPQCHPDFRLGTHQHRKSGGCGA